MCFNHVTVNSKITIHVNPPFDNLKTIELQSIPMDLKRKTELTPGVSSSGKHPKKAKVKKNPLYNTNFLAHTNLGRLMSQRTQQTHPSQATR